MGKYVKTFESFVDKDFLENEKAKMIESINSFLNDDQLRNTYIQNDVLSLYIRKSRRVLNGEIVKCLDLANISIEEEYQNQGIFKMVVNVINELNPYEWLMIENTLNPVLVEWGKKYHLDEFSNYDMCFFINKNKDYGLK